MRGRRIPKEHRIPKEILLIPARKVIKERDYGADSFSDYDVETVRSLCGSKYSAIPICDVRQQVVSLRKQKLLPVKGCVGQPTSESLEEKSPDWYQRYLKSVWWFAFRQTVYRFWRYRCALCGNAQDAKKKGRKLGVHHNRYLDEKGSILGREEISDVICLCGRCHKRHHKYQPLVPKEKP